MSDRKAMTESWLTNHLRKLGWTILPKGEMHWRNGININATLGKYTISLQAGYGPYSTPRKQCTSYTAIETACWDGMTADGWLNWVRTSYNGCDDVCPYLNKGKVLGFIGEVTQLTKR